MSTFATLRAKHSDTLRRCNAGPITPELIKEVEGFIETVRLAGREIVDEDDREYLRSLLTFWGNWYYNQTRTYPNTNLELVTPEAVAAYGREVASKIVKGEAAGSGTQNRLLIGGGILMLGLVALIALAALVVSVLPIMFGAGSSGAPTESANVAVQETLAAIATETAIAVVQDSTQLPPATAAVITVEVEPSATPFPTATLPPIVTATSTQIPIGSLPTRTPDSGGGDEPTATPLPGVGGGGFEPSIGFLSVQVIEPALSDGLFANQPFNIGAAYSNLQPGWTMFYVLDQFFDGTSFVVPRSFEVGLFDGTGLWTESTVVERAGLYNISVYITTTAESRAVLQRYADAGVSLPGDLDLEGIITFLGLTTIQVN